MILREFLDAHPAINVHCNALAGERRISRLRRKLMFLGLPAPLFTIDMPDIPREAFQRFFDSLAPTFDHMISLGQSNTIVSCPALTTHSELSPNAARRGRHLADDDPLCRRRRRPDGSDWPTSSHAARLAIDPVVPGFSQQFLTAESADKLVREVYLDVHRRYIEAKLTFEDE